jgi:aminocarboxymuconate-semialdehyde decarboxylase
MPTIDFHNHYYPPEYIRALEQGPSAVRITYDAERNPCLHYPGDYNVAVPGHRDIDYREQVLKDSGVDTQVITLTTPGTHIEEPATAVRLARLVTRIRPPWSMVVAFLISTYLRKSAAEFFPLS